MLNKLLTWYTKFFALWVVVFGVIAYFYPGPFQIMGQGMSWFFALTMFGIGAVLNVEDFQRVGKHSWIVMLGCGAQFTIMPLGAFVLGKIFQLPPAMAVGLILTGAAPGAMSSNVMSYIARADTAYSVSLTAVSTLLCPVLTPLLTLALAGSYLHIQFLPLFQSIILTVIFPLLLGLSIKHFFREHLEKINQIFPAISVTFIIFICSVVVGSNQEYLTLIAGSNLLLTLIVVVIILNIYGMLMGYTTGSLFKLNWQRRRTLAIEIGMQNAGLGTVLALKHFSKETAIPAAIFVFICILTASVLIEIWNRNAKQQK